MKLLPKPQIQAQEAARKKIQIDEGIKIARKVDALRQTLSDLEAQHSKFAERSKAELEKELAGLFSQRDALKYEIKQFEERRAELMIPLDEEWKLVRAKELEADDQLAKLRIAADKVKEKELVQDRRDHKSKEALTRANSRDRESAREFEKVTELEKATESINAEARAKKDSQEKFFERKTKELTDREESIAAYEKTLKLREDKIELNEEEIISEKIRLADQRATLERAFARLKK